MKRILVIGYRGNMGSRYCRILDYLGCDWVGKEAGELYPDRSIDGIIDAAPTHARIHRVVGLASGYGVPILAEKPFGLRQIEAKEPTTPVQMVNQYAFMGGLMDGSPRDLTWYDYFKHGGDGLAWDCINLLGMARGRVEIAENSPTWKCGLNGRTLSIENMDRAYIAMVDQWLKKPVSNWDYIVHAHRMAHEYAKHHDRDPSAFDVRKVA